MTNTREKLMKEIFIEQLKSMRPKDLKLLIVCAHEQNSIIRKTIFNDAIDVLRKATNDENCTEFLTRLFEISD